uniref:Pyrrolidone-carboxylate peptidase, related n=1 Tax=Neospora caninum (strain Liverpool) TaxID=572307 RepID=A0A0F7UDS1_NEOCL|nr:TPA: Pyrrolidone-carboxylate peptidase, related [Neospora caninum Liverpool]
MCGLERGAVQYQAKTQGEATGKAQARLRPSDYRFGDFVRFSSFLLVLLLLHCGHLQALGAGARHLGARVEAARSFWRGVDAARKRSRIRTRDSSKSPPSFLTLSPFPSKPASRLPGVHSDGHPLSFLQPPADVPRPFSGLPRAEERRKGTRPSLKTDVLATQRRLVSRLPPRHSVRRSHLLAARSVSDAYLTISPRASPHPNLSLKFTRDPTDRMPFRSLGAAQRPSAGGLELAVTDGEKERDGGAHASSSRSDKQDVPTTTAVPFFAFGESEPATFLADERETRAPEASPEPQRRVFPDLPTADIRSAMAHSLPQNENAPPRETLLSPRSRQSASATASSLPFAPSEERHPRATLLAYVTGFGPFGSVRKNPTACLVSHMERALLRAQDGEAGFEEQRMPSPYSSSEGSMRSGQPANAAEFGFFVQSGVSFEDLATSCAADDGAASSPKSGKQEGSIVGGSTRRNVADINSDGTGSPEALVAEISRSAKDGVFAADKARSQSGEETVITRAFTNPPPVHFISSGVRLCGAEILEAAAAAAKEAAPRIGAALRLNSSWTERQTRLRSLDVRDSARLQAFGAAQESGVKTPTVSPSAVAKNGIRDRLGKTLAEVESSETQRLGDTDSPVRMRGLPEAASPVQADTPMVEAAASEKNGSQGKPGDEHETEADEKRVVKKLAFHLGLNQAATAFELEKVAVNEADFCIPDQRGFRPEKARISDTGPDRLVTRLPLEEICTALQERGFPCKTSTYAGRFVCNYLYYQSLLENLGSDTEVLFVHVPPFSTIPYSWQVSFLLQLLDVIRRLPEAPLTTSADAARERV